MKKGKIICGYPGIGKSTYVKNNKDKAIDLDSSLFTKHDKWETDYVNLAYMLAKQGFIVFISTHESVRNTLLNRNIPFDIVCPSINLYADWCERLKQRFAESGKDADFRAFKFTEKNYKTAVEELCQYDNCLIIEDKDYDMELIIEELMAGES